MNWLNDDVKKVIWFNRWFSYKDYESLEQLEALYIKFCGSLGLTCTKKSLELYMQEDMKIDMTKIKFNDVQLLKASVDYSLPKAVDAIYDTVKRLMYTQFDIRMSKPRGLSFLADATIEMRAWKKNRINELVNKLRADIIQEESSEEQVDKFIFKYNELKNTLSNDCLKSIDPVTGDINVYGGIDDEEIESRVLYKVGFKPIDDMFEGPILTRQLLGISAMPGYGKTRWLCRYFIYNAIMNKKNVLFDSLDEDSSRIWSYLLCMYINDVYKLYIEPKKISTPKLLTEEQNNIVSLSRKELKDTDKFGKLIIRSRTTLTDLRNNGIKDIQENNIDIYCIDFLGDISGGNDIEFKRLDKPGLIEKGMEIIKDMTKQGNILSVIVHQFTREAIEAVNAGRKLPAEPIQGGTAAKKYSDILITMSGKPTIDRTMRIFEFIKARDNDYCKPYYSRVDLKNFIFTLKCDIKVSEDTKVSKKGDLVRKFNALD